MRGAWILLVAGLTACGGGGSYSRASRELDIARREMMAVRYEEARVHIEKARELSDNINIRHRADGLEGELARQIKEAQDRKWRNSPKQRTAAFEKELAATPVGQKAFVVDTHRRWVQGLIPRLNQVLKEDLDALEASADVFAPAPTLTKLMMMRDLDAVNQQRIVALLERAAEAHRAIANNAAGRPLTRRAHQAMAAYLVGGTIDEPVPARSFTVIVGTLTGCADVAGLRASIARTSGPMQVEIDLAATACTPALASEQVMVDAMVSQPEMRTVAGPPTCKRVETQDGKLYVFNHGGKCEQIPSRNYPYNLEDHCYYEDCTPTTKEVPTGRMVMVKKRVPGTRWTMGHRVDAELAVRLEGREKRSKPNGAAAESYTDPARAPDPKEIATRAAASLASNVNTLIRREVSAILREEADRLAAGGDAAAAEEATWRMVVFGADVPMALLQKYGHRGDADLMKATSFGKRRFPEQP